MSAVYYTDEHGAPLRPPRWWIGYLAGALLTFFGILCPCGGLVAIYSTEDIPRGPFIQPPGVIQVPLTEPHLLVIWVEEPHDESLTGTAPAIPGDFKATVTGPDGKAVPTRKPRQETFASTSDLQRVGALVFDAPSAGTYKVDVKGSFAPDQTVAVGHDQGAHDTKLGLGVILMCLLFLIMVIGGIATLIITTVRHIRHPRLPT